MLSNIHEFCAEAVRWSGNCPEATVSAWVVSALLMLVQVFFLAKRLVVGKPDPDQVEVATPVTVPYVPGETVLKLLKLLREQESGWRIEDQYNPNLTGNNVCLTYGNVSLTKFGERDKIRINHKGVEINLAKKGEAPELDQLLLKDAFIQRVRKERLKLKTHSDKMAHQAEELANRELANILETV